MNKVARRRRVLDEIVEYLKKHPEESDDVVAAMFGVSSSTVKRARRMLDADVKLLGDFKFETEEKNENEVKKMSKQERAEDFEEEESIEESEKGLDMSAIDPKILEFMDFLTSIIPLRRDKREKILKILVQEGPEVLYSPTDLEEILVYLAGISRSRVYAALKRWFKKLQKEREEKKYDFSIMPPAKEEPYPIAYPYANEHRTYSYGYNYEHSAYPYPHHYPQVRGEDLGSLLKKKIADAIDTMSAMAVLKMLGEIGAGTPTAIEYDHEGRPILKPAQQFNIKEHIEKAVKEKIEEIKKEFDEKLNSLVSYISQLTESEKKEPRTDAYTELLKLMNQNLLEILKSQGEASSKQISALMDMWSKLMASLTEIKSRGNEETLKELLNLYKSERKTDPYEALKLALDLIEKRLFQKERLSKEDVEMAKIEAKKEILQKKLELKEKELEMKRHTDLEMAKIWKDLIDSIGKELMTRAGGRISSALTNFLKSAAEYYKKKSTGAPAKIPEEELKQLSDEELKQLKEVLEKSEEKEQFSEMIESVEKEIERREKKKIEEIQPPIEVIEKPPPPKPEEIAVEEEKKVESEESAGGEISETERETEEESSGESLESGEQGNIEVLAEGESGSEEGGEGEDRSLDIDLG